MGKRELELTGGSKPKMRRKSVGWTADKKRRFFEVLAATCNISEACRTARVSPRQARRLRETSAAFRTQWRKAIAEGYSRLELMLLDRAMNGTVKQLVRGGEIVEIREYSNSLAMALLSRHRATAEAAAAEENMGEEDKEALRQKLAMKLERLRKRMETEIREGKRKPPEAPQPEVQG